MNNYRINKTQTAASALLTALFVITISAAISIAVIDRFRVLTHLALRNNNANQLFLTAQGIVDQAMVALSTYQQAWSKPPKQSAPPPLPTQIGPTRNQAMLLSTRLIDGYSRYNINNLQSANNQAAFINLFNAVVPNSTPSQTKTLVNNITDWLAPNMRNTSEIYARYQPPYRATHGLMTDISELRLVAGMTPEIFSALAPYIIALPITNTESNSTSTNTNNSDANHSDDDEDNAEDSDTTDDDSTADNDTTDEDSQRQFDDSNEENNTSNTPSSTPININTANAFVLLTLSDQLTIGKAKALEACRRSHGEFLTIDAYNETCTKGLGIDKLQNITTHSPYLLVNSIVTQDHQQLRLNSLITTQQDPKSKRYRGVVIWQMLG